VEWSTLEKDWRWIESGLMWSAGGLPEDPWGSVRYRWEDVVCTFLRLSSHVLIRFHEDLEQTPCCTVGGVGCAGTSYSQGMLRGRSRVEM